MILHWLIVSDCQPLQLIKHILYLQTPIWEESAKKTLTEAMTFTSETQSGVVLDTNQSLLVASYKWRKTLLIYLFLNMFFSCFQ